MAYILVFLTDAVLAGTRRKVKVEKIPVLSVADCADDLKARKTKENLCPSAENVKTPSSIDDTRDTDSSTLLPSMSSGSSLPSPHSKKPMQTDNALQLTTQMQNTVHVDTPKIEVDRLRSLECPVYDKLSAGTDVKPLHITSAVTREAEDTTAEHVTNVQHLPQELEIHSTSLSKAVINTAEQIECQSRVNVESMTTSERQSRERNKPQLINIRRTTDDPDQNCKTQ